MSKRGKKARIPADSVVLALGAAPYKSFEDKPGKWTLLWVGDCVKPRGILQAVQDGLEAGATV